MATLPVPGATLHYEDAGGAGTPVVFMHPASGSADSWALQLRAFASSGYRTIVYDLRGWARSRPAPEATDTGCMSDDLLALVDHLHLDSFVLVAAAYGGFGGLDFALRFPTRLSRFVLSGSQGGISDPTYTAIRERVVSAPIRGLPIDLRELGPSYRTRDPEGVQRWLAIHRAAGEPPASARQHMSGPVALPDLGKLSTPTLLIAGGADLLAPPELMRRIAEHVPNHEFVSLGEAGHCLHWEQPEEWNRVVLGFLAHQR
ncbi:MAG: alpha/beta hydrolase [Chloroflexi bacterium]|nr:alpha/beta hydrolase [Chloroflexota bacterium]